MTHQPEPVTDAVQDLHVESLLLSGSPFISSIFGPGAYRIAADAVPVFYTEPVITGSVVPPSTLFCGEGSFNSSPRATLTYQWKRDTVDIDEETNQTFETVLSDIDTTITCEVTITNASGSDTGLSNGLLMEAIVASTVSQLDIVTIAGLAILDRSEVTGLDTHIVSGMPNILQSWFTEEEAYAVFLPENLTALNVLNHDAENASMADWTMDSGGVTSVTSAPGSHNDEHNQGSRFFKGDDLGQGVDSQMSQVMTIDAGDLTDVDIGRCYCVAKFIHQSEWGYDTLTVTMEALNAADSVLNTAVFSVPSNPQPEPWQSITTLANPLSLPTLTRKIKIIVLFEASASGSAANTVYIDDISIELLKIV